MNTTNKPRHIGRNISRIRELRDMKQDTLAVAMGVSQQTISNIENSETLEDDKLEAVAKALGVSAEALRNFNEEVVFQIIGNTYHDSNVINGSAFNCNFNPLDKLVEAYEENKKLYERLIEELKKK